MITLAGIGITLYIALIVQLMLTGVKPGKDGRDGIDGCPGPKGIDGADGRFDATKITNAELDWLDKRLGQRALERTQLEIERFEFKPKVTLLHEPKK